VQGDANQAEAAPVDANQVVGMAAVPEDANQVVGVEAGGYAEAGDGWEDVFPPAVRADPQAGHAGLVAGVYGPVAVGHDPVVGVPVGAAAAPGLQPADLMPSIHLSTQRCGAWQEVTPFPLFVNKLDQTLPAIQQVEGHK
jgi:hypothetical protein